MRNSVFEFIRAEVVKSRALFLQAGWGLAGRTEFLWFKDNSTQSKLRRAR